MPWQNKEDGEEPGRRRDGKKSRNPWGKQDGGDGGDRGERDDRGGDQGSNSGNNPWGRGPERQGEPHRSSGTPDFDEFIKRSQERLRRLGGGSGKRGAGGGGSGPGLPELPWATIAAIAIVILLFATSAYQVGAGERGVITRFGRYATTTGPGFHLKLPSPIDHVTKVNFEDIRTTLIGTTGGDNENLMITGDGNVISIAYAVRWRVKNAEDFLFQIADPETTVRDATESAMREIIGRTTLDNAIGPEREAIADQVRDRVQEILDRYGAGVLVQGVDINKADPPSAVDEAFKDVSAAKQDAQQYLNQARAYAQQVQAQADGATAAFDKVYEQYRLAPEVTRKRIYLETMENVLGKVDTTVIEAPGVQTYLPLSEMRNLSKSAAQPQEAK